MPNEITSLTESAGGARNRHVSCFRSLSAQEGGNLHLRAGSAPAAAVSGDSAALAAAAARAGQIIFTGADGVAKLGITETGLWNVRTLYAAPMAGMPAHWEAFFATMVFSVGGA
ncbi:MAG TPA: hypothetical protein VHE78_05165 [Gemmatimonadaceae bacterium]|nr:hypothetical protein [Gemmatimonadaceae bacterium]